MACWVCFSTFNSFWQPNQVRKNYPINYNNFLYLKILKITICDSDKNASVRTLNGKREYIEQNEQEGRVNGQEDREFVEAISVTREIEILQN